MESREVESCILAGMLISCLGWWDYFHRGAPMHALMGLFGIGIVIGAVVAEKTRKKP